MTSLQHRRSPTIAISGRLIASHVVGIALLITAVVACLVPPSSGLAPRFALALGLVTAIDGVFMLATPMLAAIAQHHRRERRRSGGRVGIGPRHPQALGLLWAAPHAALGLACLAMSSSTPAASLHLLIGGLEIVFGLLIAGGAAAAIREIGYRANGGIL